MVESPTEGWVVLHRKVRRSELWRSLRADQRGVLVTLLLLANWKPKRVRYGDEWFELRRGELYHTLQTIAGEANCSVAVVRSTIAALMADDREVGGNGPFLSERFPFSDTGSRTGPRVLTVVNYSKYQDPPTEPRTPPNTPLAQASHGARTGLAPREQDQPQEPVQPGGAGGAGDQAFLDLRAAAARRLRPDAFAKAFDGLTGHRVDGALVLVARDRFQRELLADVWTPVFGELLGELNYPLELQVTTAGGA